MMSVVLLVVVAGLPSRTVTVSPEMVEKPVRVSCPAQQVTRIVFPEHFLPGGVKASKGASDALGIALESSRPVGVINVQPPSHPARGTLELRGPTVTLTLVLVTAPEGRASEIRFVMPAPAKPAAGPAAPVDDKTARDGASERHTARAELPPAVVARHPLANAVGSLAPLGPAASALLTAAGMPPEGTPADPGDQVDPPPQMNSLTTVTPGEEALDLDSLLLARAERIDRREGLPGQRPAVLEDALRSDRWVWLRFLLVGGAKTRVQEVSWEHGPIGSFRAQPTQSDLRIVVQLPRALVTRHTRIVIRVLPGGSYTFPVSAPWLSTFIRELF